MNSKKKLCQWALITVSIVLLVCLLVTINKNHNIQKILQQSHLDNSTYIPEKEHDNWDSEDPRGYYLFSEENNVIEIKTFKQESIFRSTYKSIGNGVFELENNQGYIIKHKDGLRLNLTNEDPLIFTNYKLFSK